MRRSVVCWNLGSHPCGLSPQSPYVLSNTLAVSRFRSRSRFFILNHKHFRSLLLCLRGWLSWDSAHILSSKSRTLLCRLPLIAALRCNPININPINVFCRSGRTFYMPTTPGSKYASVLWTDYVLRKLCTPHLLFIYLTILSALLEGYYRRGNNNIYIVTFEIAHTRLVFMRLPR